MSGERGDEGVLGEQGAATGGAGDGRQDHRQYQGYEKQGEAQDSRQLAYRVRITLLLPHQTTPDETHHSDTDSERTIVATAAEDGDMESADVSDAPSPPLSVSLSLSYSIPSTPNEQRPQCQQEDQNQGEEQTHAQRQRRRLFPLLPLPLGLGHGHDDKTKNKHQHHSNSSSTSPSPLTSPITSPTTSGSKSKSKAKGKSKGKHLFGLGLGASQRSVEDAEREIHALFGLDGGYAGQSHPPPTHGQSPRRSVEHSQRTIETLLGLGPQM
ncbi:uncharacterized protein J3D65DRAFT_635326 [Phyllosticta citribraziliensis]|uniref:Uncharacterized protein n=1 Tax=Phyllosticta citribraziliensis TaxID=989973 RepID=A0ABR1L9M1_9PEZI